MKKLILAFVCLCSILLFSCKSSNVEQITVDPLSLLDDDFSIYISVPTTSNQELVSKILQSRISGLSEKDALSITSRTNVLYAGLGTVQDRAKLQSVIETSIPHFMLSSSLTKKNGWTLVKSDSFEWWEHTSDSFELAMPTTNLLCAAQDVKPMLEKLEENTEASKTKWRDWICEESDDLRFYITRPGQYLRSLIGQPINIGTDSIYGSFSYLRESEKDGGLYELSFNIHLLEKRSVVALRALLGLSFAMAGGSVEQVDEFTLKISGIEIATNQIVALFSRDPITGKHYKVVNDEVIEESIKK